MSAISRTEEHRRNLERKIAMKSVTMSLTLVVVTTASAALAGSSSVPLDVKTGLWDMTYVSTINGAPPLPPDVLAKMPPAQKAKMLERLGKPTTTKIKDCVTSKDLAEGAFGTQDEENESCKRTVTISTATHNESTIKCTGGDAPRTGTVKVDVLSRESIKAQMDLQKGATKVKIQATGKWLGAACGDVD